MRIKQSFSLLKQIIIHWNRDNASSYAAALAYYALFALGPLFFICISICSLFLDRFAVEGTLLRQISVLIDQQSAAQISAMIQGMTIAHQNPLTLVIGGLFLLFGASGIFTELQTGLNAIWQAPHIPTRFWNIVKKRLFALVMVFIVAFLLLMSLLLSFVLSTIGHYLELYSLGDLHVEKILDVTLSFVAETVLFALIFKLLPERKVSWRGLWLGAGVTAILFTLGKFILGIYLTKLYIAARFGIASSLIFVLIWIYYSSQILFLGAEFTKVISEQEE